MCFVRDSTFSLYLCCFELAVGWLLLFSSCLALGLRYKAPIENRIFGLTRNKLLHSTLLPLPIPHLPHHHSQSTHSVKPYTNTQRMAPAATTTIPIHSSSSIDNEGISTKKTASYPVPLKLGNALDGLEWEDTTPVIGREFIGVNIVDDILNAPNADERLRDLAITSEIIYFFSLYI